MIETQPQMSATQWFINSLGVGLIGLVCLFMLLSSIIALFVSLRGRGPMAVAALILVVPLPLLVGIFAGMAGQVNSYLVVATSSSMPKPSDLAAGMSTSMLAPLLGLIASGPGFLIALVGSLVRATRAD